MKKEKDLKIVIITQGISLIVKPLLESSQNIIGITESSPRVKLNKFKKMVIDIIIDVYEIFSGKLISLKKLSNKKNIPYYYMENGCDLKLEKWLKSLKPDLIVIYSMSELLKENIIKIPSKGVINLHPSLLPKYRGPNPHFWMYHENDLSSGVSVHFIDTNEDTGDIICQKEIRINAGTKKEELIEKISKIGSNLIIEAIKNISNDTVCRIKQPNRSPTIRARNIKLKEYRDLIRWKEWDVDRIWNFFRGTEEYIINLTNFNKSIKKGIKIEVLDFKKCLIPKKYNLANIYKENGRYFIICKNGIIHLNIKFSFKKLIYNSIL